VAREVQQGVRAAADVLRDAGMTIQELELPGLDDAPAVQRTIIFAEAAAYHQKSLLAQPSDYSQPLREQLALGLALPATQYLQAQRLRRLITGQFLRAFRSVDLLVCPAAPLEATPLGQQSVVIDGETLEDITVLTRLTNPFNVTGLPAITVPCGFSQNDLPLGVQLIGRPFEDDLVLAAAHTYEQATPWHRRTPSLAGRPA
jgi:aspartyl-tRNA(Asn)/glutamyl-tRNA(Gln) amidotransferase subunit A